MDEFTTIFENFDNTVRAVEDSLQSDDSEDITYYAKRTEPGEQHLDYLDI